MKKPLILLSLALTSTISLASEIRNIVVERSLNLEVEQKIVLPFSKQKGLILKDVWRSPAGIACKVNAFGVQPGLPKGNFECKSPEGYKAQMSFDCSVNRTKETSAYLFFGRVGSRGENSNFYIWCN